MKRKLQQYIFLLLAGAVAFSASCEDPVPDPPEPAGKLIFEFDHRIDGAVIDFDTIMYMNAAGNQYGVNEIQYFITDVTLYNDEGGSYLIDAWKFYHYVDSDIPATLTWKVFDSIPVANYDSIAFTFGFTAQRNESFMFVNPPENGMVWPEFLGGGYHYMKLNMKWIGQGGLPQGNAFHLGIGQTYDLNGNVTGFIQNFFRVSLPSSSFSMADNQTRTVKLVMNIEEWFKNPNVFDFDTWGGDIMQNQDAMHTAAENGVDVFTVDGIQ